MLVQDLDSSGSCNIPQSRFNTPRSLREPKECLVDEAGKTLPTLRGFEVPGFEGYIVTIGVYHLLEENPPLILKK
eukprot:6135156-Amphidinium_carterae.1